MNLSSADRVVQRNEITYVYAATAAGKDPQIFSCYLLDGDPMPSVAWYHGKLPISSKQSNAVRQVSRSNGSDLVFHNINGSSEGEYKCIGINRAGVAERSFTLIQLGKEKLYRNFDHVIFM